MENFIQLAKDRYSVRKFTPGEIPAQDIEKILEAGRLAPTAVNFQPIFFWVFRGESKQKLLECTKMKFIGDADVIIAVGSKADGAWVRCGCFYRYNSYDACNPRSWLRFNMDRTF